MRALSIGVAAHITAAAEGGPRYNATLTAAERASIDNAIWLCHSCGALIDRDPERFTASLLVEWKSQAENAASRQLCAGSQYRPVAASEIRQELTLSEVAAIKALSEEFGCHIETEIQVPAGGGWLNLQGAVVRGEDLVAIDIREHHGHGIAYFQIEYLLDLCEKLSFPRFRGCVLYLVVVSDGPEEADQPVVTRLADIVAKTTVETQIRMYRLNSLRAKYEL